MGPQIEFRRMTAPSTLFRPFTRLIKVSILGKEFEVPANNTVLRCLQYLQPEPIAYGRFCWNEDCQYCRISFDMGEGTARRAALSCKLMAEEGMRIHEISAEISHCLRELKLKG